MTINRLINTQLDDLKAEQQKRAEAFSSLRQAYDFAGPNKPVTRLALLPIAYANWEAAFCAGIEACFFVLRESSKPASVYSPGTRATWLKEANFYTSFVAVLQELIKDDLARHLADPDGPLSKRRGKKSRQTITANLLENLDRWSDEPLDTSVALDKLVQTFSNVNEVVIEVNAFAAGLDLEALENSIDTSELNKFVGLRNAICHGSTEKIGEREFLQLLSFAESLTNDFLTFIMTHIGQKRVGPDWKAGLHQQDTRLNPVRAKTQFRRNRPI